MLTFQPRYFLLTVLLLLIEISIALYVHDKFVRPYVGDALVVILIYCFIKSFFSVPIILTAFSVLLFSFLVETLQYFNVVNLMGLQHSTIARIVIGTSFAWEDILAYTVGIGLVMAIEKSFLKRKSVPEI